MSTNALRPRPSEEQLRAWAKPLLPPPPPPPPMKTNVNKLREK